MKLCDVTQAYAPTSGGIKTYIEEKRRAAGKKGYGKHILIIPGTHDDIAEDESSKTYRLAGSRIPGCDPYRFTFNIARVASILEKERPDVIEFGSPYLLPFAAFHHRRKNPCVITGFCHTDFPKAYIEQPLHSRGFNGAATGARHLAETYMRYIYNRFDTTFVASESMLKRLIDTGISPLVRVNLGVDTELFHPRRRDFQLRAQLGLKEQDILLVYSGRLDEEKRIGTLIDSFTLAGEGWNGHLAVMGNGPKKNYVIEQTKRNSRIRFLPYESDRMKLATLLASADIYVTAGPHETFALSVIEAQASGLPVIGVRAGALIERVTRDVGLLCEVDAPHDMAAAIRHLSANGYRTMGARARSRVEQNFSWQITFNTLFEHYERLRKERYKSQR